jgi:hypothetical protein
MKAVQPVIASNGVRSLQMRSIISHSRQEGRRKERRKRRGKNSSDLPSCPWSHGLRPKIKKNLKNQLVWRCHQHLSGFLAKRPLAPSVASVTSVANDKVDNEMILGPVYRSPGICLTAEENLS